MNKQHITNSEPVRIEPSEDISPQSVDVKASNDYDDSLSPYFNASKDGCSTSNTRKINNNEARKPLPLISSDGIAKFTLAS